MLGFSAVGEFPLGCIYVVGAVALNGIMVSMNLGLETKWVASFGIMQNPSNTAALQCVASTMPGIVTKAPAFPANLQLIVSSTEAL